MPRRRALGIMAHMDQITAMRAFVRVVESGTFTHAAKTLCVGAPTVTRLIQELEHHLQVRLLHRTTRAMRLTTEGRSYYERVVRLLVDLADVESSAKQSSAKPSGHLRVECAPAIGTLVLVPALPEFHQAFPELEVNMSFGDRSADLIRDGIDCAIRLGEIQEQDLVARRIGKLQVVTCATPEFLKAHGVPETPDAIGATTAIRMYSTRTDRALPYCFATDAGPLEIAPPHGLLVNDCHAYLAAGLAGLGLMQAPTFAVRNALSSGRLVAVLEDWRPACTPVHVVYRPNRFLCSKVRVFIDWVVEIFRRNADLG